MGLGCQKCVLHTYVLFQRGKVEDAGGIIGIGCTAGGRGEKRKEKSLGAFWGTLFVYVRVNEWYGWNVRVFSMINSDRLELNTHATSSQRVGEQ